MTPEGAIQEFMSGFGIDAYSFTATPSKPKFPYLTYELPIGYWDSGEANMPVNVWYRTDSEIAPNEKVREIGEAIGLGGKTIPCDGGMLWLKKGSPFANSIREDGDDKVKRRYVNIDIEFLIA